MEKGSLWRRSIAGLLSGICQLQWQTRRRAAKAALHSRATVGKKGKAGKNTMATYQLVSQ